MAIRNLCVLCKWLPICGGNPNTEDKCEAFTKSEDQAPITSKEVIS